MDRKPNILLVFSDQHRWCDLGCYGNEEVISPNFDAFAAKAAVFTNCISNSPVCVPARGSLLTGLMAHRHRAITNDLPIDTSVESIASVLNRNGYHTGYIGKWHLGGVPRSRVIPQEERLGFNEWKVCNCSHNYMKSHYYDENNQKHLIQGYEPIAQTDLAIDFIQRNNGNPWGLVVSYGPPHDPYFQVPDRYLKLYQNTDLSIRENVPDSIMHTRDVCLTKEDVGNNLKGYYAHITALDEQFGRLMDTLDAQGELDNTIIVYTSDHGDMLGSQGLTNKQLPYDESIKVPLMIYYKDNTLCTISDEMLSLVDLPVSLLGLASMRFANEVDGDDLHQVFIDSQAKGCEYAYIYDFVPCHQAYFRGSIEWRGIRTKAFTYARSSDSSFAVLFNNQEDPLQRDNLISDSKIRNELECHLRAAINRWGDEDLPWDKFIRDFGYTDEWNKSQLFFNLPTLE